MVLQLHNAFLQAINTFMQAVNVFFQVHNAGYQHVHNVRCIPLAKNVMHSPSILYTAVEARGEKVYTTAVCIILGNSYRKEIRGGIELLQAD